MSATTITGHQSGRKGRRCRSGRTGSGGGLIASRLERIARRKLLRTDLDLARTWSTVRAWDWTTKLLAGSAAALVPWIVFLALTLPARTVAHNWSTVWIGFDLLLATAFAVTARLYLRNDPRVGIMAAVVATLLIVDGWFDTSTASKGLASAESWFSAIFVEIPIAAFCARLAWRSSQAMVNGPLGQIGERIGRVGGGGGAIADAGVGDGAGAGGSDRSGDGGGV